MKTAIIAALICLGFVGGAAAEGKPKAPSSSRASKAQLSEIRSVVRDLEKAGSTLEAQLSDYRSLMSKRPATSQKEQFAKWEAVIERLLDSMTRTHTKVVDTTKRLDQVSTAKLPTSLAKEEADARNAAGAARAAAEQVLAKRKPKKKKTTAKKPAPKRDEAEAHLLDDLGP
jgi:hypothetical protein